MTTAVGGGRHLASSRQKNPQGESADTQSRDGGNGGETNRRADDVVEKEKGNSCSQEKVFLKDDVLLTTE